MNESRERERSDVDDALEARARRELVEGDVLELRPVLGEPEELARAGALDEDPRDLARLFRHQPPLEVGEHRVAALPFGLGAAPHRSAVLRALRLGLARHDPLKQWKLSPMDVQSRSRWEAYTKAKEAMLERTHIAEAPWWIVEADDKKRARLNCISHLLTQVPYQEVQRAPVALPPRTRNPDYLRGPVPKDMYARRVTERRGAHHS